MLYIREFGPTSPSPGRGGNFRLLSRQTDSQNSSDTQLSIPMRAHFRPLALRLLAPLLVSCAVAELDAQGTVDLPIGQLAERFEAPDDSTKPKTYWYWMDGRQTAEGITKDLEAMKRAGVGEAFIGMLGGQGGDTSPAGRSITAMSEEWWGLIEHAIREGGRLGVDIGVFNGLGWSQSGGPWNTPEKGMRLLVSSETRVEGPVLFDEDLPADPRALPGQDVRTIAFPEPVFEDTPVSPANALISGGAEVAKLFDGDMATSAQLPVVGGQRRIDIRMNGSYTARSLVLHPALTMISEGQLQTSDDGVNYTTVASYAIDRRYGAPYTGIEPLGARAISFPPVTAEYFRITVNNEARFAEIELTGAARVEQYVEKHFGKMFNGPKPPADYFDFPVQDEPDDPALAIPADQVVDITPQRTGDRVTWQVPEGRWVIQRLSMAYAGTVNTPAPPGGGGPEIDKINKDNLRQHFDGYVGKILERMPAADRTALKRVVIDSYEVGSQIWTDGMADEFEARCGYDPVPFLPVLGGRMVGSAEQSDRFLWDFRRFLSDRLADEYIGGMKELANAEGLRLWSQNYGHGGFFGEFLNYGGRGDEISGEFWQQGTDLQVETRCAASAAHIYGKKDVYAEAWTGGPPFRNTPWELKQMGDWAFCEGINHMVFHVNLMQPRDSRPGISAWFGTEFNRNNTWYDKARSWTTYLQRCHTMLKQGIPVADVAYYIGEDVPAFIMEKQPQLPEGYSYDYINADVILNRLTVVDGRFVLPDGVSYGLLVLPDKSTMRPEVLEKIRELVAQGGRIYGRPPEKSPSFVNFPQCDAEVSATAAAMWQAIDGSTVMDGSYGSGRIFNGAEMADVLAALSMEPDLVDSGGLVGTDILFAHRRTPEADIYFISNQTASPVSFTPSFRVEGKAPSLWNPVDGTRLPLAAYNVIGGRTQLPLDLAPQGSMFVVFEGSVSADRVIKLTKDEAVVYDLTQAVASTVPQPSTFTTALWVKPATTTTIPNETKTGFSYLYNQRAEIIFPTQGQLAWGDGHAGSGLSVGTNGVVVYEHSAQYFAPLLVHPAALSDWTHVAVVYDQGQTRLYLDGVLADTGLTSDYVVHPGDPNSPYSGEISGFRRINRALAAGEVAGLMESTGPGGSTGGLPPKPIELTREDDGSAGHLAWKSGSYSLTHAAGETTELVVGDGPEMIDVTGAWEVRFPPASGAPSPTTLTALTSLTQRSEPTIRYFSGTAIYSKSVNIPAGVLGEGRRLFLDLGSVGSLARVVLNGEDLGSLWGYPYRIDISGAAKAGDNQLQVHVTNAWHNRLAGAAVSPASFTGAGIEQVWGSSLPAYNAGTELLPSGLMGPVKLLAASTLGKSVAAPAGSGAAIGTFTGGDPGEGLDLTGNIVHALNLAGAGNSATAPDLEVAGVVFKDPYGNGNLIPGVEVGYQAINNWEVRATYPEASADDQNLAEIMWDVAHGAGIADEYPAVTFSGLTPGKAYELLVLAADADSNPNRATTYQLHAGTSRSGVLQASVTDLNLSSLQGATVRYGPIVNGVVVTLRGRPDPEGNLYFCSPDGVVPGGTGPFDSNGIVQALVLKEAAEIPPPLSAFEAWMDTIAPSLTGSDRLPGADPDGDGVSNLMEFATGGDPGNTLSKGWVSWRIDDATPPAGREISLVFAGRRGASFSNGTALVDGIRYTVEGSTNLLDFDVPVHQVSVGDDAPAGLDWPEAGGSDWEYHRFKLSGSDGLMGRGFVRLKVIAE